jgi:hypothetical protein
MLDHLTLENKKGANKWVFNKRRLGSSVSSTLNNMFAKIADKGSRISQVNFNMVMNYIDTLLVCVDLIHTTIGEQDEQ